jgi:large subunit ribosomal protein L9
MKVVLIKDVQKVGHKHDIKDVSDGFALNFLIPQGLAETATPNAVKRVEKIKSDETAKKQIRENLLLKNFGDLKGITVEVEKAANEEGHLFASVHKDEIVAAIKDQTRLEVEPEFLQTEPVKTVGDHEIEVKVGDRAVSFTLKVNAEGKEKKEPKTKAKFKAKKTS